MLTSSAEKAGAAKAARPVARAAARGRLADVNVVMMSSRAGVQGPGRPEGDPSERP